MWLCAHMFMCLHAYVFVCLYAFMFGLLACLCAWHARVFGGLVCSRTYVLVCLAFLLALYPYILYICFTCLLCSSIYFVYMLACTYLPYIWKVNFQILLFGKLVFIQGIWNTLEHLWWSFLWKKLQKLFTIFAKKLHHRCSAGL